MRDKIKVVALMEAPFVTGPAKNMINFANYARTPRAGLPAVEMSVISFPRSLDSTTEEFINALAKAQIPVDRLRERRRFDTAVIQQIRDFVEARDPDIVETHNVKSHFLLRLSKIWKRYPWLAFQHGYVTTDLKMRAYNQLDRWSLLKADHVLTVCQVFADDLVQKGIPAERITVRHNSVKPFAAVSPEEVLAVRQSLPVPEGVPILLSVGRLSHEKGHFDLVQALGYLRRELKEEQFHLVLVGEGLERGRIEAAIQQLGLHKHVTMAGLKTDVRPYYASADIVVIPSHSEGSPNVLLEAMICELPIVATRAGGLPEIAADDETALLVPTRDIAEIAKAIQRLLHSPELRMRLAKNAKTVAGTQYSMEAYHRSLVGLYDLLTDRTYGLCSRSRPEKVS